MPDHLSAVLDAAAARVAAVLPSYTVTPTYVSRAKWGELSKPAALVFNPVASAEEISGRQMEVTTDVSVILLRAKGETNAIMVDAELVRDDVIDGDTLGGVVDRTFVPDWGVDFTSDAWEAAALVIRGIESA